MSCSLPPPTDDFATNIPATGTGVDPTDSLSGMAFGVEDFSQILNPQASQEERIAILTALLESAALDPANSSQAPFGAALERHIKNPLSLVEIANILAEGDPTLWPIMATIYHLADPAQRHTIYMAMAPQQQISFGKRLRQHGPRCESICNGGAGSTHAVVIQLRNVFPGPGGQVITEQDCPVAFRAPKEICHRIAGDLDLSFDLCDKSARAAFTTFLRHTIAKKLDDFFLRTGKYRFAHVPRPLGCTSEGAYLYEWVHGYHGYYFGGTDQRKMYDRLGEYSSVARHYLAAGIEFFYDLAAEHGGVKNIIMQEANFDPQGTSVTQLWKRIDFGPESMRFNYGTTHSFIAQNRKEMEATLRPERVRLIELALDYLIAEEEGRYLEELGELAPLLLDFREASAEYLGSRKVRDRVPISLALPPSDPDSRLTPSFMKNLDQTEFAATNYYISSSFECVDGIIFTIQEVPGARAERRDSKDPEIGFRIFLKTMLATELENFFIAQGRYSFPHVPRPLGSNGKEALTEYYFGRRICSAEFLDSSRVGKNDFGLAEWQEFVLFFRQAGIEMRNGITFGTPTSSGEFPYARQIIVRQPGGTSPNSGISRLWKRVGYDDRSTPYDLNRLAWFLRQNQIELVDILTPSRYNTLVLAAKYLSNDCEGKAMEELIDGVRMFRGQILRHLNVDGFEPFEHAPSS